MSVYREGRSALTTVHVCVYQGQICPQQCTCLCISGADLPSTVYMSVYIRGRSALMYMSVYIRGRSALNSVHVCVYQGQICPDHCTCLCISGADLPSTVYMSVYIRGRSALNSVHAVYIRGRSAPTSVHVCVYQGQICPDKCTCCHTEIGVADQTFYLTESQYADTRSTSPSADPTMAGTWHIPSHWTANV